MILIFFYHCTLLMYSTLYLAGGFGRRHEGQSERQGLEEFLGPVKEREQWMQA